MAKLILRKTKDEEQQEAGQTVQPATPNPGAGQNDLSEAMIQAITSAVVAATSGQQTTPASTPVQSDAGVAKQFGDRHLEKLKETLGEETTEALLGAFDALSDRSSADASILLEAIQGQQTASAASMKSLEEQIQGFSKVDPEREWMARGYDVFTQNQAETLAYLEQVGEAAGPLLGDAVEKFEKAQDEQDYEFLDKVRAGLTASLAESKKDHAGVPQSGGIPLTKSEKLKAKEEAEAYQKNRNEALSKSDPKERLAAILDMGTEAAA